MSQITGIEPVWKTASRYDRRCAMFPDRFLLQLLVFAVAQVAAWGNMLTGRFSLGFVQFAALLILADGALILHLVQGDPAYVDWVVGMQAVALTATGEFAVRRWLRRRASFQVRQRQAFGAALDAWIAGQDEKALVGFRRIFRLDPWDAEAACMVAKIHAAHARKRRALRWFARARARARTAVLRDEISEEIGWLKRGRARIAVLPLRGPRTAPTAGEPRSRAG